MNCEPTGEAYGATRSVSNSADDAATAAADSDNKEDLICFRSRDRHIGGVRRDLGRLATYLRERLFLDCIRLSKVQTPTVRPSASPSLPADKKWMPP
jgi:hypothetical protein